MRLGTIMLIGTMYITNSRPGLTFHRTRFYGSVQSIDSNNYAWTLQTRHKGRMETI